MVLYWEYLKDGDPGFPAVQRRLTERSVVDHFYDFLQHQGADVPAELRSKPVEHPTMPHEQVQDAIHKLYKSEDELKKVYDEHKGNYKELKEALIEDIENFVSPMRKRREELERDKGYVEKVLKEGALKAKAISDKKMKEVKEKIGILT